MLKKAILAFGVLIGLCAVSFAQTTDANYGPHSAVSSFNTRTGAVTLQTADVWGGGVYFPATMPTLAAGSAGALTGTYYYFVTYTTAVGETDTFPFASVTVTAQQVNLTNIPVSSNPAVTGRNIYRTASTVGSGNPYMGQFVTHIADNTTTTYTDNLADGSLGAYMPGINTTVPQIQSVNSSGTLTPVAGWGGISLYLGNQSLGTGNTGYADVAIGANSMPVNTGGDRDVAVGVDALISNTLGSQNVGVGVHALGGNTTGSNRVAIGYTALQNDPGTSTLPTVAIGAGALQILSSGVGGSVAVGYNSEANVLNGGDDTSLGYQALVGGANSSCSFATAIGWGALQACTSGNHDTAVGLSAGASVTSGASNTLMGDSAGAALTTGGSNVEIGRAVGSTTLATGSSNILLGTASNCDTTAAAASTFLLCATTGSTPLLQGNLLAASPSLGISGKTTIGSNIVAAGQTGDLAQIKETDAAAAPGAGYGVIKWVAGTNSGTAKILLYAGTSTTPVVLADNIGGGF